MLNETFSVIFKHRALDIETQILNLFLARRFKLKMDVEEDTQLFPIPILSEKRTNSSTLEPRKKKAWPLFLAARSGIVWP